MVFLLDSIPAVEKGWSALRHRLIGPRIGKVNLSREVKPPVVEILGIAVTQTVRVIDDTG